MKIIVKHNHIVAKISFDKPPIHIISVNPSCYIVICRSGLIEEGLLSEDDPDSLTLSDDAMNRRDDLISKYRYQRHYLEI